MNLSAETYSPPTLTVYGSVIKLTASGTLGSCENGNTPNGGGQCGSNVPNTPLKRA